MAWVVVADQVKDLSGKAVCPCGGRQQEVPWAIKDRCGQGTGSAGRAGAHIVHLNFSPFTGVVSAEAFSVPSLYSPPIHPPDQKKIERYCFASNRSQGTVHSL